MLTNQELTTIDNPPSGEQALDQSHLGRAIRAWRNGRSIPLDVASALMEDGFDLPALEAHYAHNPIYE